MEATETDPSKFMPNSTWAPQSQGILEKKMEITIWGLGFRI